MTAAEALDELEGHRYLSVEIELEPVGSPTIQPASFANTGPSFYEAPGGELAAVVESVASMANLLELTLWDETACAPRAPVAALPWVRTNANGAYYTSSRRAAHRLNAASIMNGAVASDGELFGARLGRLLANPTPPVSRILADVVWDHDPLALLHGCWFPGIWDGRARITRALSGRIDALGVRSQSAQVGGQKTRDTLDEPGGVQDTGYKTVRGEAPYFSSELSADRIVSPIVLDVGLLRSYGLDDAKRRALVAAGVLMIAEIACDWPRRRSRCMLAPVYGVAVKRPADWVLPAPDELRTECEARCEAATGVSHAVPLEVTYAPKVKVRTKPGEQAADDEGAQGA